MSPVTYLKIFTTTLVVTLFLFFTSVYISMKLGAMPWPIVFSIVVSAGLLCLFSRHVTQHEVNMAQAGGTIGGEGIVGFVTATLATTTPANLTIFRLVGAGLLLLAAGGILARRWLYPVARKL